MARVSRVLLLGALTIVVIIAIDAWLDASPRTLVQEGVADESGHLLTTLLLLAALTPFASRKFVIAALLGSVLIDLDHLPLVLGSDLLTRTTNRPFPHALLTIAIVLLLSSAPRWREFGLGMAAGLASHFLRDMGTSPAGVPLLWPLRNTGFLIPDALYLAVLLCCVLLAAMHQRHTRLEPSRLEPRVLRVEG